MISHLGGHLLRIIVHFFSQSKCDVVQLTRYFLRFTYHLQGALYDDVTAIRCDNGFVLVDIGG
jgi:hypothetical protein